MIVCIAGMHRSGTSMVARLLNLCGLSLGVESDIMPANKYNSEGYWENVKFVDINDRILAAFGGGWDTPPKMPPGWVKHPRLASLQAEAQSLIEEFAPLPAWGWKDPRNSLTLPFWQQFLPDMKVILCLRNPLEVARSLENRGASSHTFSFNLWRTYNKRLLAAVPPKKRLVTHYASYFMDPAAELRRVLAFVGLRAEEDTIQAACATALASLRHSQSTLEQAASAGASVEIQALYTHLSLQAGPIYLEAIGDDLQKSISQQDPVTRRAFEDQLLIRLAEKEQELRVLRPLPDRVRELTAENARFSASLHDLASEKEDRSSREEELVAESAHLAARVQDLTSEKERLIVRVNELAHDNGLLASQNEHLAAHEQLLISEITEIQASLAFRALHRYRLMVEGLLPDGSRRRRLYSRSVKGLHLLLTRGPRGLWSAFRRSRQEQPPLPSVEALPRAAAGDPISSTNHASLAFTGHKILCVAQTARRAGDQIFLLDFLRWLKQFTAWQPYVLFLENGDMLEDFRALVPALVLENPPSSLGETTAMIRDFSGPGLGLVYCTQFMGARLLQILQPLAAPIIVQTPDYVGNDWRPEEDIDRIAVGYFSLASLLHQDVLQEHPPQEQPVDLIAPRLLAVLRQAANIKPAVSIIVPCFNHADFLPQRLDSILHQTFRDYELILLDDASSDATAGILQQYAGRPDITVEINQANSGSTFAQWIKGIQKAKAGILWIAEDDDSCEMDLLEKLLPFFQDPEVRLAYCQSSAIDEQGQVQFSYLRHTREFSADRWSFSYIATADEEVNAGLAITNTIPNASAVLFRPFDLEEWVGLTGTMKLAGDWLFYLFAIRPGKIAFWPEHLNYHRRHQNTNIHRTQFSNRRFIEVAQSQKFVADHFNLTAGTRHKMQEYTRRVWDSIHPGQAENFEAEYRSILGS